MRYSFTLQSQRTESSEIIEETQQELNAYQPVSETVVNAEHQNFITSPNDVSCMRGQLNLIKYIQIATKNSFLNISI